MGSRKPRVYISGKINGTTDFMERFARAEEKLKSEGYAVLNPTYANSYMPEDTTWEECMKVSITLLSMADAIYMLNGWEDSKGACFEYEYAKAFDKTIMIQSRAEECEKDVKNREVCYVSVSLIRGFSKRNFGEDLAVFSCPNCGRRLQNNKNNNFCPRCGAKIIIH